MNEISINKRLIPKILYNRSQKRYYGKYHRFIIMYYHPYSAPNYNKRFVKYIIKLNECIDK